MSLASLSFCSRSHARLHDPYLSFTLLHAAPNVLIASSTRLLVPIFVFTTAISTLSSAYRAVSSENHLRTACRASKSASLAFCQDLCASFVLLWSYKSPSIVYSNPLSLVTRSCMSRIYLRIFSSSTRLFGVPKDARRPSP